MAFQDKCIETLLYARTVLSRLVCAPSVLFAAAARNASHGSGGRSAAPQSESELLFTLRGFLHSSLFRSQQEGVLAVVNQQGDGEISSLLSLSAVRALSLSESSLTLSRRVCRKIRRRRYRRFYQIHRRPRLSRESLRRRHLYRI